MKRRTFLLGGGATVAAGGFLWANTKQVALGDLASRPKLSFPPLIDARNAGQFTLQAQSGQTSFFPGRPTPTLGFNQSYLGPVVKLAKGEVTAQVSNSLDMDVSCHWHGLLLPGDADGGPHQPIAPGETWTPVLPIDQPACTAWYHTHIHGATATGVYAGLAGGLIVDDGDDDARGLPNEYGKDDLFLILQDKQFHEDGSLAYDQSMPSIMHGFSGDTIVVNGQIGAAAHAPKGLVRLRLLNGCNARIFTLYMQSGREMHLIATDGGYLPKPIALDELRLSPGERAEVLVDFGDGRADALLSRADMNSGMGGMMGRFQRFGNYLAGSSFEVLPFAVKDEKAKMTRLPDQINHELASVGEVAAGRVRQFSLDMPMGPGRMMDGGMSRGGLMAINQRPYDMGRVDFEVQRGSTERWQIFANTLAHPFHIHGVSFRVISENGGTVSPGNTGWKDTVLVNQSVELVARFDQPTPPNLPFMYHCHILEHEDNGMMGQFLVV